MAAPTQRDPLGDDRGFTRRTLFFYWRPRKGSESARDRPWPRAPARLSFRHSTSHIGPLPRVGLAPRRLAGDLLRVPDGLPVLRADQQPQRERARLDDPR